MITKSAILHHPRIVTTTAITIHKSKIMAASQVISINQGRDRVQNQKIIDGTNGKYHD